MALLAFTLLNLCAYNALASIYGQTIAALILAVVDAAIAWVLFMQAQSGTPTSEEAMVDELRALALAELSNDAARLKAQLGHLQKQVTKIGEGILARSVAVRFVEHRTDPRDRVAPVQSSQGRLNGRRRL